MKKKFKFYYHWLRLAISQQLEDDVDYKMADMRSDLYCECVGGWTWDWKSADHEKLYNYFCD